MIELILSFFIIAIFVISFFNLRKGIAIYILYIILVPYVRINIGPITLGENLINLFLLILFLLKYNKRLSILDFKSLAPFFLLYFIQFLLIPFQTKVPIELQYSFFRASFMSTLILPFIMINIMKFEPKASRLFHKALITGITISVIYGILLIFTPGINPYLIVILPLWGGEFDMAKALSEGGGRLFGKISSVFIHPMTYGLFLSFSFVYILSIFNNKKKNIFIYLILSLIVISIFTCGIRTPIAVLLLCTVVYFFFSNGEKKLGILLFSGILVYIILMQIPESSTYISSMFSLNSEEVRGSSISSRIIQLEGAIDEIKGNELTGLGHGWTGYYISTNGGHPIMLHFESILIIILCNSGYIGLSAWFIMSVLYYNHARKNYTKQTSDILLILFIAYLSYAFITGEYGYMRIFLIFYAIIIGNEINKKNIQTKFKVL